MDSAYHIPDQAVLRSYFLVDLENEEQSCKIAGMPCLAAVKRRCRGFVLGNGSNLLVGDRGYRGAILHLAVGKFLKTEIEAKTTIRMQSAGALMLSSCIEKRDGSRA